MKIIAVIPVFGRVPLLKYTIQRLLKKNGVSHVICVGNQAEDKKCVEENGAQWVEHENILGGKWNAGFLAAREHKPDGVLFVGSSDWISDNWLDEMAPLLETYDLIGKPDFHLLDINEDLNSIRTYRACHWHGYQCHRKDEPIGIGRLISARVLDKINWKPFVDTAIKSMDYQMYRKVIDNGGEILTVPYPQFKSLSISTNRWANLHKFEDHWRGALKSERVEDIEGLLNEFPEARSIVFPPPKKLKIPNHRRS